MWLQVYICMLSTLAWHDSTKLRAKRKLDFVNLDHTTWKDFLWEFLRYAQQPAWWRAHVIHRAPEKPLVDLQTGDVRPAPPPCTLVDTSDAAGAPEATNGSTTAAVKAETKPAVNGGHKSSAPGVAPTRPCCATACTARVGGSMHASWCRLLHLATPPFRCCMTHVQ